MNETARLIMIELVRGFLIPIGMFYLGYKWKEESIKEKIKEKSR